MLDASGNQRHLTSIKTHRTLVACVGNSLVGDDAAGCEVFDALQRTPLPSRARVRLLALSGLSLVDELGGEERLIVVDAVRFGAAPGTVHILPWEQIPKCHAPAVSVHGIGIWEAVSAGRILYPDAMPKSVLLVGIEGECFDKCGVGITPAVREAIDEAVLHIRQLLSDGEVTDDMPDDSEDALHQEHL